MPSGSAASVQTPALPPHARRLLPSLLWAPAACDRQCTAPASRALVRTKVWHSPTLLFSSDTKYKGI